MVNKKIAHYYASELIDVDEYYDEDCYDSEHEQELQEEERKRKQAKQEKKLAR